MLSSSYLLPIKKRLLLLSLVGAATLWLNVSSAVFAVETAAWLGFLCASLVYWLVGWPYIQKKLAYPVTVDTVVFAAASGVYSIGTLILLGRCWYAIGCPESVLSFFSLFCMLVVLLFLKDHFLSLMHAATIDTLTIYKETDISQATVWRAGAWQKIAAHDIQFGDLVYVYQGQHVPADGIIFRGRALINEQQSIGVLRSVEKKAGDELFAGSYAVNGSFEMHAVASGCKTVHARVSQNLEQIEKKIRDTGNTNHELHRYTLWLCGVGLIGALVSFLLCATVTLLQAVAMLLVIVIVVPVSLLPAITLWPLLGSINQALKKGMLINNEKFYALLGSINTVVFEKTGVITQGIHTVEYCIVDSRATSYCKDMGILDDATLYIITCIYAIERQVKHPIAHAIQEYIEHHYPRRLAVTIDHLTALSGCGVTAVVDGRRCIIGSRAYVEQSGLTIPANIVASTARWALQGKSICFVGLDNYIVAYFCTADVIRAEAVSAIALLKKRNKQTVLLTGEHERTAQAIGAHLAIDTVVARTCSTDKNDYYAQLQQQNAFAVVARNSASPHAQATFGMGNGIDTLVDGADFILLHEDLMNVAFVWILAARVRRIMRQNYFFMGCYVAFVLFFIVVSFYCAIPAMVHLFVVMIAFCSVSLLIAYNSLRVRNSI